MTRIIIVAAGWQTRAYLIAQLQEEGFEVGGAQDFLGAAQHRCESGIEPDLVIADASGLSFNQEAVDTLGDLCPRAPLLIVHGSWDFPASLRWDAGIHRLAKPVTVGGIVDRVREILEGREGQY